MKYLLGKKIGMTQLIAADGAVTPVTVIEAGPCAVTQIKATPKASFQIGFGVAKKINKPLTNHLKENKVRHLREFPIDQDNQEIYQAGKIIDLSIFDLQKVVKVSGISKGKGFAGTVKRYNFKIGPKSHGSKSMRQPGSTGCQFPQRKIKGKKTAGRMGNERVTVRNLPIMQIETDKNLLVVGGSVPGNNNSLVIIQQ
jgi:large subunit ribosomal protein L3